MCISVLLSCPTKWNLSENSVSILFVGDGFPVPLHNSLFTVSPHPFGRFFRLLREAKRLPYALTNWNLTGYRIPGHCEPVRFPGVAIPRIDVPLLVDKFQKTSQKNGLYDDRLPEIRWGFPHQCARWFGMTCSDGAPIAMSGISMPRRKFVLPPAPVCALVPPPSQVRGARRLSTRAP